jgi:hypothetical protein
MKRVYVRSVGRIRNASIVSANLGAGRKRANPNESTTEQVAVIHRETRPDLPSQDVADEHWRRRAGAFDQSAEPRPQAVCIQPPTSQLGRAVSGQVGCDDAVRGHEIGNHPHPHAGKITGAVQQQDRRAYPPF